jgi:beta-phosphoglucomutase-like phosphatase (HAD superfamily)
MPIKAVLFDMDGVLLDSEPLHDAINLQILRELGVEADSSVTDPFVGRTSEALWGALKEQLLLSESIEVLTERQWAYVIRALPDSGIEASEGLHDLLTYIEEHSIRATIASSSRGAFVEAVLEHLGIARYFEGYTCGVDIVHSKPAPDIFLLAAEKLGVLPSECLVIEDSSAGVRAGKAAGMYTVGYVNPTSEGQDVSAADVMVVNLADVRHIIAQKNAFEDKECAF